jgi:hypothetical protein
MSCSTPKLDRRNFQRKILSYGIMKRLKEVKTGVAYKLLIHTDLICENITKLWNKGWREVGNIPGTNKKLP